ncbi:hypothetical protein SSS_04771 [Sarcoptes scabiei]|nr:hypothetical protein SSS_04771 [Sarcoptes scabiei]
MQTTIAINLFDMVNRLLCRYPVRRQQRLLIISLISAVLFELTASLKITNIIPNYCDRSVESKNQYQTILLNQTGSETASLQLGANILKGIEILPNYQCNLIVQSPPNTGLVLTFRKTALNNKDSLTVRTGSNPGGAHVWNNRHHEQRPDNEHGQEFQEVATLVNQNYPSSLIIKYQPALGIAHFNSGFDLAITLFTGNFFLKSIPS